MHPNAAATLTIRQKQKRSMSEEFHSMALEQQPEQHERLQHEPQDEKTDEENTGSDMDFVGFYDFQVADEEDNDLVSVQLPPVGPIAGATPTASHVPSLVEATHPARSLRAVARAKNTIAFLRATNEGTFNNADPHGFAVIVDGNVVGVYDDEDSAHVAAVDHNAFLGGLPDPFDGVVFPLSGTFDKRRTACSLNGFVFDPLDPLLDPSR